MAALITDLERIAALAEARYDEFEVAMYQLQYDDDLDDDALDQAIDAIAQPIVEAIDCTQCANCCRALTVELYEHDAPRLAEGLRESVDTVRQRYIQQHNLPEDDMWGAFKHKPCALLKDNLCTVYEHRPDACRDFPSFTPDFRWTMGYAIKTSKLCPIVYNVLSGVVENIDRLQRQNQVV